MDPTISPYANAASATPGGAGGVSTQQLAAIIAALQQQGGQGAASAASPAGGQSSQQNPMANAGNMMKGLIAPPQTSMLGSALGKIQNAIAPTPAGPTLPGGTPAGTFEGNIASPANPYNANGVFGIGGGTMPGSAGAPVMGGGVSGSGPGIAAGPIINPGSPSAMSSALMNTPTNMGGLTPQWANPSQLLL